MVLLSLPRWKIRSLSVSFSPSFSCPVWTSGFVVNVNIRDLKVSLLSLFQVILYKKIDGYFGFKMNHVFHHFPIAVVLNKVFLAYF